MASACSPHQRCHRQIRQKHSRRKRRYDAPFQRPDQARADRGRSGVCHVESAVTEGCALSVGDVDLGTPTWHRDGGPSRRGLVAWPPRVGAWRDGADHPRRWYSSVVSGAKIAVRTPAAASTPSTCVAVAVPSIRPRAAVTRWLIGLASVNRRSQSGMVSGSTKMLLRNVTGNRITKPMLMTALGERRISPSVVQAQDNAEAKSSTRAIAATTPAGPPPTW